SSTFCTNASRSLYRSHCVLLSFPTRRSSDLRNRFFQGNAVNLKLLEALPEKISGNLNSYEAYGTCYSVLYVHGGQDLEHFLEGRSEEHTSELQSRFDIVCRLLLEKKNKATIG